MRLQTRRVCAMAVLSGWLSRADRCVRSGGMPGSRCQDLTALARIIRFSDAITSRFQPGWVHRTSRAEPAVQEEHTAILLFDSIFEDLAAVQTAFLASEPVLAVLAGVYTDLVHSAKTHGLLAIPRIFAASFTALQQVAPEPYWLEPFTTALEYHGTYATVSEDNLPVHAEIQAYFGQVVDLVGGKLQVRVAQAIFWLIINY